MNKPYHDSWDGVVISIQDDLQKLGSKEKYDHEVNFGVTKPRFVFSNPKKIKKGTKVTIRPVVLGVLDRETKKFILTISHKGTVIKERIHLVHGPRTYFYSN